MDRWNLIIDVERCEGCNNCALSAKDEHIGNTFPGYSAPAPEKGADLITVTRRVRGEAPVLDAAYLISMCNHCDDAPCMKIAGDAVRKREDGIVIIDPEKAKGRKDIVSSCPYGAIVWNESLELPQIWIFDAHLLDQGWKQPRCVQSCPTDVFEAVKISDAEMSRRVQDEGLEVLRPEVDTKPRVYYRNLYRFNKCFIGGTVVAVVNGVEDCVPGASVSIVGEHTPSQTVTSDEFGEFKLDRVPPNSGRYEVVIEHPEFGTATVEAIVKDSINVGVIKLGHA
ncbi:MAG: 4Fe-4S dicluster domain-containing protein [Pseudomonadota bacterium]